MIAAFFLLLSCSGLKLKPKVDGSSIDRPPDYEETIPYYFFGLVGKKYFDIHRVCHGRAAEQIQTTYTPADLSYAATTLFFYFPKTVRIWCKE